MKFGKRSLAFKSLTCALTTVLTGTSAYAFQTINLGVVATPGAPVTLTHCGVDLNVASGVLVNVNAVNRADVFLSSYVVRWFLYDHSGTMMGQKDLPYSFETDLAPSDTTASGNFAIYNATEPLTALSRVNCRLESAQFEGGLKWTYGRTWRRRIAPLPRLSISAPTGPNTNESAAPR